MEFKYCLRRRNLPYSESNFRTRFPQPQRRAPVRLIGISHKVAGSRFYIDQIETGDLRTQEVGVYTERNVGKVGG